MSAYLRPWVVSLWRWFTGPASAFALLLVGLYLLTVSAGPPLVALWLIGRALTGVSTASIQSLVLLGAQVAVLAVGWYLARRYLPPFRWRA